jgi:hypothetical protein
MPALEFIEPGQKPVAESLQGPTEFRFAGQQKRQAQSKDRENHPDGSHGAPFKRELVGKRKSVPPGQFSEVYGQPPVMGEVKEFDFTKQGSRDRRGCKSPPVWIAAEFEAGQKKPYANAGLRTGDQGQLREDVGGAGSRHRDPDQTALGLCRRDLALHARDRNLRGGRFPLATCAKPCDRLFVRLDLGSRGLDGARVDDRAEFQPGREMKDVLGRIRSGWQLVGAGNGNEGDVDFHRGGWEWGGL